MPRLSIEGMRSMIEDVYNSASWKDRVRKMPDKQVYAIWMSFDESGKFDRKPGYVRKKVEEDYWEEAVDDFDESLEEVGKDDPTERFTLESDRDYYDRLHFELEY